MSLAELDPRQRAQLISKAVPVSPQQIVVEEGFKIIEPFFQGIQGVGVAQRWLDERLAQGNVIRTKPGVKAQIIYWDGRDGIVASFNQAGIQVGLGHAKWNEDPRKREREGRIMAYDPMYLVASGFERQGLGFTMMQLLEEHIALNNQGIGATFFYTVQAETPENRQAAFRMIQKMGAKQSPDPNYFIRIVLKRKHFNSRRTEPGITMIKTDKIITMIEY